jgi:hypothetical protein
MQKRNRCRKNVQVITEISKVQRKRIGSTNGRRKQEAPVETGAATKTNCLQEASLKITFFFPQLQLPCPKAWFIKTPPAENGKR